MREQVAGSGAATNSGGRNLTRQMRSYALLAIGFVAATCLIESVQCNLKAARVYDELQRQGPEASSARRSIFSSEFSLRNSIQETNSDLRQLKRDFVQQMSDLYIGFRLDTGIGYKKARDLKLFVASANILMAEQFAELVIKKHIIERRLLTGLKRAYIKLLPMQTLVNLYRRHPDEFAWLRYQQQVDIRPKFEGLSEGEFGDLYRLIGLRAKVRAAEDVLALTSGNIQRILQTLDWYLVAGEGAKMATSRSELITLASHAKQVLTFYLDEVVGWNERLYEMYDLYMRKSARKLAESLDENAAESDDEKREESLVRFLDRLINVEALDIGLNQEARSFEEPPTITEQMINKLQSRWIPSYVLEAVAADRKLLVTNRKRVSNLVKLRADDQNRDLAKWALDMYNGLCQGRL